MSKFIPLSEPNIGKEEIEAVSKTLKSGWVSSAGPDIIKFEKRCASYLGAKYAVACSNGTAALQLSLHALGVKDGHDILLPSLSFIATANAISYIRATPIFLDISEKTLCLDLFKAKNFIKKHYKFTKGSYINKVTGNILFGILPVDMLGSCIDRNELAHFCNEFKIKAVIDSAEAFGSKYKQKKLGSYNFLTCFSFNGNKILTTGGGGLITTNNSKLAKKIRHLATTAKTNSTTFFHNEIGYNYRLVNLLASLGLAQLKKIDSFLKHKKIVFKFYLNLEKKHPELTVFQPPSFIQSNYWLNLIQFSFMKGNKDVMKLVEFFEDHNIQCRPFWMPIHMLPMYCACQRDELSVSENLWNKSIMFPSSSNLSTSSLKRIEKVLSKYLKTIY